MPSGPLSPQVRSSVYFPSSLIVAALTVITLEITNIATSVSKSAVLNFELTFFLNLFWLSIRFPPLFCSSEHFQTDSENFRAEFHLPYPSIQLIIFTDINLYIREVRQVKKCGWRKSANMQNQAKKYLSQKVRGIKRELLNSVYYLLLLKREISPIRVFAPVFSYIADT